MLIFQPVFQIASFHPALLRLSFSLLNFFQTAVNFFYNDDTFDQFIKREFLSGIFYLAIYQFFWFNIYVYFNGY